MDLRVGAYAIITDGEGRILLSHWVQGRTGAWTLPGGGMEPGEDPVDTVVREVMEETGYDAEVGELLGVHSHVISAGRRLNRGERRDLQSLRIIYRAEIVGGELRFEVDGSTDRAEWFPLTRLPSERVKLVDIGLRHAGLAG